MSGIDVVDLAVGYDARPVLTDLELHVPPGSRTAVLGASGDGKSTLLRTIAGFLRPARGSVVVGGRQLSGPSVLIPPEQRDIGYVRQDGVLFPHLDVAGNVSFGLPRIKRRGPVVSELLELVGLRPEIAHRRPDQLSGGQQQRVALARALARQPQVVLLDEPFSSLDVALRAATRAATAAALAERNATAVLVTHDQAEALSFANQVAVLVNGTIRQAGPPQQLYERPIDLEVARLLGEVVLLDGTLRHGVLRYPLGQATIDYAPDGPVQVMLRPEQLCLDDPQTSPARGTVASVHYHGPDAVIDLRLDDCTTVQARTFGSRLPRPGDSVGITVAGALRLLPQGMAEDHGRLHHPPAAVSHPE